MNEVIGVLASLGWVVVYGEKCRSRIRNCKSAGVWKLDVWTACWVGSLHLLFGQVRILSSKVLCGNVNRISAASDLDALLEPLSRCLDAESARRVVEFQIEPPVQERIDALAEGANEGALSDGERSEYEALINAADFLSILKLKARQHLGATIQ